MAFDYKEYARKMRKNAVKDDKGNIHCSPELWEQIARIIENIPTAEAEEAEWISVKDKLPLDYVPVLVYDKYSGTTRRGFYVSKYEEWIVEDVPYFGSETHKFTHWRNDPPCPKEYSQKLYTPIERNKQNG